MYNNVHSTQAFWEELRISGSKSAALSAKENATDAYEHRNAPRAIAKHWGFDSKEKVSFLVAIDGIFNGCSVHRAKRAPMPISKLNGFDEDTILVGSWSNINGEEGSVKEPSLSVKAENGQLYELFCFGQTQLKVGGATYLSKKFLDANTNGIANRIILTPPTGLPTQKANQWKALRLSGGVETACSIRNIIWLPAVSRVDQIPDLPSGRKAVVHCDPRKEYELTETNEVNQALLDGFTVYGQNAGINTDKAQLRPFIKTFGIKIDLAPWVGATVTDYFGVQRTITQESVITTTDNLKDKAAFKKNGGVEEYERWIRAQFFDTAWACELHTTMKEVTVSRQISDKLSQLTDDGLWAVAGKQLAQLVCMGFKDGYEEEAIRRWPVLFQPELKPVINSDLIREQIEKSYLRDWHKLASGGFAVEGEMTYLAADPRWMMEVLIGVRQSDGSFKKLAVDDPNAGMVPAGTVWYGGDNDIGKDCVLFRYPQIKHNPPVVKVDAPSKWKNVMLVSMRPGDTTLINLDADLDGDKVYAVFNEHFINAIKRGNEVFEHQLISFDKFDADPAFVHCSMQKLAAANFEWNRTDGVGIYAGKQWGLNEMLPLIEDGKDWKSIKVPTLDENGNWSVMSTLEEAVRTNVLLTVAGNMATDMGKIGHKPDLPKHFTYRFNFRAMSERDAHPNKPEQNSKKHMLQLTEKGWYFNKGVLRRTHDLLMKWAKITETGRTATADFLLDEQDRPMPDKANVLYRPEGWTPVDESVWIHAFDGELADVKFAPVINAPSQKFISALGRDLQVIDDAEWNAGVSLITFYRKYCAGVAKLNAEFDKDFKTVTFDAEDAVAQKIVLFVKEACGMPEMTNNDALWVAYNTLSRTFLGSADQSRGSGYAMDSYLKAFGDMLLEQVCANAGRTAPKRKHASSSDIRTQKIEDVVEEPVFVEEVAEIDEEPIEDEEPIALTLSDIAANIDEETMKLFGLSGDIDITAMSDDDILSSNISDDTEEDYEY